jgi:glucosamine--fructose-6-phosphate aminotransferase (isomerizing)
MCGIVGVIGPRPVTPIILEALRRLEYRGYDSAGIATLVNGHIERRRAEGKLANLAAQLEQRGLAGTIGIGHTRWATHGAPTESNAHPHGTARVSLVHNGIIENHAELRAELEAEGQEFGTETDTETVAQLVDLNLKRGMAPIDAAGAALRRLEGAYALAMIFAGHPELIVGAQHGAPLAVGFGDDEMFVGSDALALAPLTRRIAYLHDGDWTVVDRQGARFFDIAGKTVEREIKETRMTGAAIGKGNFRHFMEKELHEHPAVIGDTLHQMISPATRAVALPDLGIDFACVPRITMSACGSAFYAGLVGRWWFEALARIPTDGDVASEFRYRTPPMPRGGVGLLVSQSGETADTLAALRYMREQGQHVLSILNVPESTMARESDAVLETVAGPEIGVASTKAFTAQLSVLACLALAAGRATGAISTDREAAMTAALLEVPGRAAEVLADDAALHVVAQLVSAARDVLFLGRGNCFPIALEGALKLKEISYIHAEGYAAGEMKHGPIALIDPAVPVIAIAPSGPLFEKTASNLQEAAARGGQVIVFSDAAGAAKLRGIAAETVVLPEVDPFVAPILYAIPVQMLAYQVAVLKGTDVDQPRNLAKSVTVE